MQINDIVINTKTGERGRIIRFEVGRDDNSTCVDKHVFDGESHESSRQEVMVVVEVELRGSDRERRAMWPEKYVTHPVV